MTCNVGSSTITSTTVVGVLVVEGAMYPPFGFVMNLKHFLKIKSFLKNKIFAYLKVTKSFFCAFLE